MLTNSQKELTNETFKQIIKQTIHPEYQFTSMKAHYLILRNFDNHADLWIKLEKFISRSLPTLNKYRIINNIPLQDLVYTILVPQFIQLSKPEILEITILYSIQQLTKHKAHNFTITDHFSDFLEINPISAKHVCKFQDVKKLMEDLDLKVSIERQGSFQQEWCRVLKFALMRLYEQKEPICSYLANVLNEYMVTFVRDDKSFAVNEEIYNNWNELVQRGIITENRFKSVKNQVREAKKQFENDIIFEQDLDLSQVDRKARDEDKAAQGQQADNVVKVQVEKQKFKRQEIIQPKNHTAESLNIRKSRSFQKPLQPLDILYEDFSRHQSSESSIVDETDSNANCSIMTGQSLPTTHNSDVSDDNPTDIPSTQIINSPKYEDILSPVSLAVPQVKIQELIQDEKPFQLRNVSNDSNPQVLLGRNGTYDLTSDAEQNAIQISDLAEVFEYQKDQVISEKEGDPTEKVEETFEITDEE